MDTNKAIDTAFDLSTDALVEYNKRQLLEGKTNEGIDIAPTYLNDPYFKSKEAAQRYSDWKDRITPNPKRKSGVPNLYIVGAYHNSINLKRSGNSLRFNSSFPGAASIAQKFEHIYGLGGEIKREFNGQVLRPNIMVEIRKQVKL